MSILTASAMVDDLIAYGLSLTPQIVVTDDRALLVEAYLAAHYYKYGPDRQLQNKGTAGASGTFTGNTSEQALLGTTFGQTATNDLDPTGYLYSLTLAGRPVIEAGWLGTPVRSRQDYQRRNY